MACRRGASACSSDAERSEGPQAYVPRKHVDPAIGQIEELQVDRLLGPERAVVVEDGDTLWDGNKLGRALPRRRRDELDDGLLCRRVVLGS